jgi:hypothetical protein
MTVPISTWQYNYPHGERPAPEVLAVIVIAVNELNPDGTPKVADDEGCLNANGRIEWFETDPAVVAAMVEFGHAALDGIMEQRENGGQPAT